MTAGPPAAGNLSSNAPTAPARPKRSRWRIRAATGWLALLVLLHIGLGLMYDRATPIFEPPDEGYHFAVLRWIQQGHGLPVQQPGQASDWQQEGSQPPLYYILAAFITRGVDTSDWKALFVANPFVRHEPGIAYNANAYRHPLQEPLPYQGTLLAVHLARWLSLALSALTVILSYRLALAVFPGRVWLALLAAAFVAFAPQVLFINASVNNDNLLMTLDTAALLAIVHFTQAQVRGYLWKAAVLGLLLGLAALTKVSGLVLWPVAAVGVAWGAWRGRDWKRFVVAGFVIALLAVLVCGWWYWRNDQLYGEWLGLKTMVAVAGPRVPPISLPALIEDEWYGFFVSFWAVFGPFTILPAGWVLGFYILLTVLAIAGGAWAILGRPVSLPPALWLLAGFCLLTLVGVIGWSQQTPASQGRLMYGAIAPLSIFLSAGILSGARPLLRWRAGPNWAGGLVLTLCAALALVASVVPAAYISPHYAPPTPTPQAQLPADLNPVDVTFNGSIQLLGYTSPITPVVPGERQPVTLFWRSTQPIQRDYVLALHLLGQGGAEVSHLDTWPGGGNGATSQWTPGTIYADSYLLPVSREAATPSRLRLSLYFWDGDPSTPLSMTTASGAPLASVDPLVVGGVVAAHPAVGKPTHADGSNFQYGIVLSILACTFGCTGG